MRAVKRDFVSYLFGIWHESVDYLYFSPVILFYNNFKNKIGRLFFKQNISSNGTVINLNI